MPSSGTSKAQKSVRQVHRTIAEGAGSRPSGAPLRNDRSRDKPRARDIILDTAEEILRLGGYGAVTIQSVAERASIKRQLVHYHFRDVEGIFLALWRRHSEKYLMVFLRALSSPHPLRAVWESSMDPAATVLSLEFMAMARHYSAIGREIKDTVERSRKIQADVFERIITEHGLKNLFGAPEMLAIFIAGVSGILVKEDGLGITLGHSDLRLFVDRWLTQLEAPSGSVDPSL